MSKHNELDIENKMKKNRYKGASNNHYLKKINETLNVSFYIGITIIIYKLVIVILTVI